MKIFKCTSVLADNKQTIIENASEKDWQKTIKKYAKENRYMRFTLVSKTCITVDYGSWSDFFGIEGTENEMVKLFPEFFNN